MTDVAQYVLVSSLWRRLSGELLAPSIPTSVGTMFPGLALFPALTLYPAAGGAGQLGPGE